MENIEVKTSVTQEDVDSAIAHQEFKKLGEKTTLCFLKLKNGFEIVTTSGCVDPLKYCQSTGEKIALQRAKDKIWELLGFNLQCEIGKYSGN